ncbi:MAG: Glycine reductase complex selenoprotein [Solirubrobacteraceae bacterium]|jgi:glycine reductase|nr:Glycine reductase complex selenoprotein [Solirubrobacteraceae bacterium]
MRDCDPFDTREEVSNPLLTDKLTIVLGERDGIAGPAIAACVRAAQGTVAFASTECFV